MNTRRGFLRRPLLIATAALTGALLAILPAAAASAATATWQRGIVGGSHPIHQLTFVVTNDSAQPLSNWRVDFDLTEDTSPAPWPSPWVLISFSPSEVGRHITVTRGFDTPIAPGGTFRFTLPMRGTGSPINCVVGLSVPCAEVSP